MDVAIPEDRNIMETERKLNTGLCIEIQRTWNMKCMIVPVINGAAGIVIKVLKRNSEALPGKHSIYSVQKTYLAHHK